MAIHITKLFQSAWIFPAFIFLCCCAGKDGDPGPAGQPGPLGQTGPSGRDAEYGSATAGSIKGNVSGTLSDGTPFSEDFTFNKNLTKGEIDTDNDGYRFLSFERYSDDMLSRMSMLFRYNENSLQVVDYDNTYPYNKTEFSLTILRSGNKATEIHATPKFFPLDVRWPIEPTLNHSKFHFDFRVNSYGNINIIYQDPVYQFGTEDGSLVSYDKVSGTFVQIQNPDGSIATATSPYDELTLAFDSFYPYFMDESRTNLSTIEIIPSDPLSIKNYSFDKDSGNLKFEFSLTISGSGRAQNNTDHPLTVTGNLDVFVYSTILH